MQRRLSEEKIELIKREFQSIHEQPQAVFQRGAFPQEAGEKDIADLPRLCLTFNRIHYGFLRLLIDRVNDD
jgi:hypothetical protein